MKEVVKSGKARFWGITGLPVRYLSQIARETNPDTVLSWAHYNLLEDEINSELVPLSQEMGFGLMNAGPLMQRLLSDGKLPSWHRSPPEVKAMQPALLALCKSYGVRLSDVALRYAMDHPYIVTTIIGMGVLEDARQNVAALNFEIPVELLTKIETLLAPVKNRIWYEGMPENNI
jgi:L-galactose dehydrogenase